MSVRVRVAPSPTGHLHIGTARAALFNWLYARRHGGTFIVRIDDTDTERSTQAFEEAILESLRWLGLDWDEGVGVGGPHGSYRQSARTDRYREVAERLVSAGSAYRDGRTSEELDELRDRARNEGLHPGAFIRRPDTTFDEGAIRLSVPQRSPVVFEDLVRGEVRFEATSIDDFVILRSDGSPTYHLASTVDDIDYGISHVARGEDLLPSTPKHILLTRAIGAEEPAYAHLPLLFGPDGKKLSKRHGATAVSEYRDAGYLAEAVCNYLALLGWSFEGGREIFTLEEAAAGFDFDRVSKNPAMFDPAKLDSVNGEYVRALSADDFAARARPFVEEELGRPLEEDERSAFVSVAPLVQERTRRLDEVGSQVRFLFEDDLAYDEASWAKEMEKDGVSDVLTEARVRLADAEPFDTTQVEQALRGMLEALEIGARKGLQPVRVAVTGSSVSPPLFESVAALGRHRTLARLDVCLQRLAGSS